MQWRTQGDRNMTTQIADSKGRITLGRRFANRTVIIEYIDETEVRVTLARVIPEHETWLYENDKALASIRRGLEQARTGKTAIGPKRKTKLR